MSRCATALPRPEAPPVTTARTSFNFMELPLYTNSKPTGRRSQSLAAVDFDDAAGKVVVLGDENRGMRHFGRFRHALQRHGLPRLFDHLRFHRVENFGARKAR